MTLPFTPPPGGLARSAQPVTVLVADPHSCVREGVKALLGAEPDLLVVGEAGDGPAAVARAADLSPDLVVLEPSLSSLDGAQVTARLRQALPGLRVLVLTACENPGTARRLFGTGARGYALKRSPVGELLRAVRAVAAGGTYLDPALAGCLVSNSFGSEDGKERPDVELGERETQVLRWLALGFSNKEIAGKLKVSGKTVETDKVRAMKKLTLHSRVDLVRHAAQSGWLFGNVAEPLVLPGDGHRPS